MDRRPRELMVKYMLVQIEPVSEEASKAAEWPSDPESQREQVSRLAAQVLDPVMPWWMRQKAYDHLLKVSAELAAAVESGKMRPESIPRELSDWWLLAAVNGISRPKQPRGGDRSVNVHRDWVYAQISDALHGIYGCGLEEAAELIAEQVHLTDHGVQSAIRRGKELMEIVDRQIQGHTSDLWNSQIH